MTDTPNDCNCECCAPPLPIAGAGPTVADEEALLQAEFGVPNQDGIYAPEVTE